MLRTGRSQSQTGKPKQYLEIGDRSIGNTVVYPDDDLIAVTDTAGNRGFTDKDGLPY